MRDAVSTPLGVFREVARRPHPLEDRWMLRCPGCGVWGYLDEDQWRGRVSVDHAGMRDKPVPCSYHETHDFATALAEAIGSDP